MRFIFGPPIGPSARGPDRQDRFSDRSTVFRIPPLNTPAPCRRFRQVAWRHLENRRLLDTLVLLRHACRGFPREGSAAVAAISAKVPQLTLPPFPWCRFQR